MISARNIAIWVATMVAILVFYDQVSAQSLYIAYCAIILTIIALIWVGASVQWPVHPLIAIGLLWIFWITLIAIDIENNTNGSWTPTMAVFWGPIAGTVNAVPIVVIRLWRRSREVESFNHRE